MAQLDNVNPVIITGDTDINTYVSELINEFKPTKLQDSERSDPRDEFPLPNAKRSRILESECEDHLNVSSVPKNSENQLHVSSDLQYYDDEQSSEFSEPTNSEIYKNPFQMFQQTVDLFSQLNEFLIPSSDPLLNSYLPVSTHSHHVPYELCEPSLFSETYFPGYINSINNLNPDINVSNPDPTNQPPQIPPKSPSNNLDLQIQKPKYPPFDESKSLLHDLLTAPLKPKPPKNPSVLHNLLSSSNINSPNDEIQVLSHVIDKAQVNADDTMMPNTTDNTSVSGVKHKAVIDSAIGKLVMSFVLPVNPSTEFGQFGQPCKTKKREECSICHKRFENKYKLKVHMNCHTGNRPYVCETCGASFLRSTNLVAHRRIHKPKEYQCPLCDKLFAHNSDRVVHIVCQVCITVKHMMEAVADGWQCKECGECLTEKTKLEKHVKKHKKSRSCPVCLLDFSNVREHQLVSHVRSYQDRKSVV